LTGIESQHLWATPGQGLGLRACWVALRLWWRSPRTWIRAKHGLSLALVHPSAAASAPTLSQEAKNARLLCSSSIACSVPDTSCRSQNTAPPTELLTTSSPAEYMEDRQQMALTTAGLPSCPQKGISVIISTTTGLVFFCVAAVSAGDCEFFLVVQPFRACLVRENFWL
jgi:hypothetical protein